MSPLAQQPAHCLHKSKRLVQEQMVICQWNGNQGSPVPQHASGVLNDLRWKEGTVLTMNHSQAAFHFGQLAGNVSKVKPVEKIIVEFPTPASVHFGQRTMGDIVQNKF